jgi:hypothetical protein
MKIYTREKRLTETKNKIDRKQQKGVDIIYLIPVPYTSVADPCHFGVDPDPDPRIHASD